MSTYQAFLDGLALGIFLGFLAFYLAYRFWLAREPKPKDDVDILVDEIRRYYRHISERKRRNFD